MKVKVKEEIDGHICTVPFMSLRVMAMTGVSRGTGLFDRFDSKGIPLEMSE